MMAFVGFLADAVGDCNEVDQEDGEGADMERRALCGTWVYDKSYAYGISRTPTGDLYFEEPPRSKQDMLSENPVQAYGYLKRQGSSTDGYWYEGATFTSMKRPHGHIRLRYVWDTDLVISSVQLIGQEDWGGETIAYRREDQPCTLPLSSCTLPRVDDEKEREMVVVPASHLQRVNGADLWPQHWGLTRAQCRKLLWRLRKEPSWNPTNTVSDLVAQFVVPWTRETGMGYALLQNRAAPKEANVLVSHAWSARAEDLLEMVLQSTTGHDVIFIAALSLSHAEEQQQKDDADSLCQQVLEHIRNQRQKGSRCSRCCWSARIIPAVLFALAMLIFYSPMLYWGCVPNIDASRCAVRRTLQVGGDQRIEWIWLSEYEAWLLSEATELQRVLLARLVYPVAGLCLLMAIVAWSAWRFYLYDGRLLVVPCHECKTFTRLGCVREIASATTLGVPVTMSSYPARLGRIYSRGAVCQDTAETVRLRQSDVAVQSSRYYSRMDSALRRVRRTHRLGFSLELMRSLLLLAVVVGADQRLVSFVGDRVAGCAGFATSSYDAVGIVGGILLNALAMVGVASCARPRNWCLALLAAAVVFLILAGTAIGIVLALTGEVHVPSVLADACTGHLGICSPAKSSCQPAVRLCSSLAQTLLVGGGLILLFLVGSLCLPSRVQGWPSVGTLMLLVAAALTASPVQRELGWPAQEFSFPVAVAHLTAAASRGLAPVFVLWRCACRWGLRVRCAWPRRRPTASTAAAAGVKFGTL